MKILNVIPSMDPATGGPCQGIRNFVPEIRKLGSRNLVVSLDAPTASFIGTDAFTIHPLGPGTGPWRYSARLYPWLVNNLKSFDVVIVHGLWLYHAYAVRKAIQHLQKKKLQGRYKGRIPKVFVMTHGMLDPYFQHNPARRLKALRNWMYWKWVEARLVNSVNGVLFTCQKELMLAREPFRPYSPKKEINIGYGIEEPVRFLPEMQDAFAAKCPEVAGKPYLLFISRIHPKKGVEMLIDGYEKLARQVVAGSLPMLVIAGPGLETPYGRKLKARVDNSGLLQGAVFFPGMISGYAKWGAFYGCDAFVLPSRQENFGIAVAEALACGKPVLISDQVNICEEIREGGAGLVESDTPEGTYAALHKWHCMNLSEREKMAEAATLLYQKTFTVKSSVKNFMDAVGR